MSLTPSYLHLNPDWLLRGWKDLKHGLVNRKNGKMVYLVEPALNALELAWNGIPVNSPVMLPMHRKIFEEMLKHGFATLTDHFIEPLPEQKMKKAECNYTETIHWSITGRCNMKCRHCYVEAPDALYGELPLDKCIQIMDQMVEANIASVSLTGGEPLVRPDWKEFYQALKDRNISVNTIYTNGLLVTDRWLDEFEKMETEKLRFSLSFDGIGHHDWLRGMKGMEQWTIDAIKRLRKRGYPIEIETALYKDNIPSMPDTCTLLAELGVGAWKLSKISPSGAWIPYAKEHSATKEELLQGYLKLLDRFQELGRPFTLQIDHRYSYSKERNHAGSAVCEIDDDPKRLKQPVCGCMHLHPYLLPDGTLMPCMPLSNCGLDKTMPNLLTTRLVEVLSPESKFFDFITISPEEIFKRENTPCATCEYRCRCCCGCRARALAGGSLYGPDPEMCDFFRGGERKYFEPYYDKK